MKAIYKRELSACFRSPIGYLFCAIYLFFSGMYFNSVLSVGQSSEFPEIYYGMLNIVLLMLPLLTMRLFSEERKYKTDQILLTSPINIFVFLRACVQLFYIAVVGADHGQYFRRGAVWRGVHRHRHVYLVNDREPVCRGNGLLLDCHDLHHLRRDSARDEQ